VVTLSVFKLSVTNKQVTVALGFVFTF